VLYRKSETARREQLVRAACAAAAKPFGHAGTVMRIDRATRASRLATGEGCGLILEWGAPRQPRDESSVGVQVLRLLGGRRVNCECCAAAERGGRRCPEWAVQPSSQLKGCRADPSAAGAGRKDPPTAAALEALAAARRECGLAVRAPVQATVREGCQLLSGVFVSWEVVWGRVGGKFKT
jgi:hypothetical protein